MKREDFINALDAIGKIKGALIKDISRYTAFNLDQDPVELEPEELDAINELEQVRQALIKVKNYLMLHSED